ncbi:hypothetical protein PISMIDRAFT_25408 [Pisolithus microcarpus 441]|uniref:Uncharacterized protein n=1 Tax=Pisolithus microcarpus 441 TaxID=765257 RepID=A0A0C9YW36_9AGAM|nr:hypothetical protein BKA83DRAFT_25408 [Pisolithus microcarpus]KIK14377.1 hypothetical protein PISMIDRAFT_25408 [Pisolithus microcarpus 441]
MVSATHEDLVQYVPDIRRNGIMSDDTLTYELNISKNQFFRDYGMELQPSDPVDVEMQPSPSTSHSQNLPTPGSTSIASSSCSPSVQAGILYVPGTSPVATTSCSPSAQVPNLPVPDSGSIPTTPGLDLADADNALVGGTRICLQEAWWPIQGRSHEGPYFQMELSRHDCLLGGIDYTINYRWKDSSEADWFAANLWTIRKVIIWPPARELEHAGWKFPIIDDLYAIATSLIPACPPITRRLCTSDPIPPDTVLKRSHSDCSAHVIMPDASNKRMWPYLMSQAPTGEMWMAQQHMPMLSKFGEWRVFIVGGKIIQVVHTHRAGKGDWHASRVLTYWSLEELRAKIQNQGTTTADVVNPNQGTSTQRDRAKEEFENFMLETWKLDIGLGMKDGRLMYFVNEVERSLTTSLWMNSMPDGVHGIFADMLASTLYDWLSGMMDLMHL